MTPQFYERLYGLRTRLLAGTVALTLLAVALLFRPERSGGQGAELPDSRISEASGTSVRVAVPAPPAPVTEPLNAGDPPAVPPSPEPAPEEQTYTVRRGDCVWRIAESHCGSGFRWSEVYNANQSQITNPDLIYPDQRFTIPCGR